MKLLATIIVGAIVVAFNLALLGGAVWVVIYVLRATGVLS